MFEAEGNQIPDRCVVECTPEHPDECAFGAPADCRERFERDRFRVVRFDVVDDPAEPFIFILAGFRFLRTGAADEPEQRHEVKPDKIFPPGRPVLLFEEHGSDEVLDSPHPGFREQEPAPLRQLFADAGQGGEQPIVSFRLREFSQRQVKFLRDEQQICDLQAIHIAVGMHDAGADQEDVAAPDRKRPRFREMGAASAPYQHEFMEIVNVQHVVRLPEMKNPQRHVRQS